MKEQQDVVDKIFLVEATTTHKAVSSFDYVLHLRAPSMKIEETLKYSTHTAVLTVFTATLASTSTYLPFSI